MVDRFGWGQKKVTSMGDVTLSPVLVNSQCWTHTGLHPEPSESTLSGNAAHQAKETHGVGVHVAVNRYGLDAHPLTGLDHLQRSTEEILRTETVWEPNLTQDSSANQSPKDEHL